MCYSLLVGNARNYRENAFDGGAVRSGARAAFEGPAVTHVHHPSRDQAFLGQHFGNLDGVGSSSSG